MIPRTHRFHGHGSLRYVYSRGQVVRGPLAVLKYIENPKRSSWRAAVVVSRKVHKSAVKRNRIRRRIYEIVRTSVPNDAPPWDIVFIVHTESVASLPAEEVQAQITSQLRKAKIT